MSSRLWGVDKWRCRSSGSAGLYRDNGIGIPYFPGEQVIRKNYPVVVGNHVAGSERETVSVVGPLCTPLDLLADNMEMAKADVGDLIVVFQSGAYGLTASPTAFLSHPAPAEVLV